MALVVVIPIEGWALPCGGQRLMPLGTFLCDADFDYALRGILEIHKEM